MSDNFKNLYFTCFFRKHAVCTMSLHSHQLAFTITWPQNYQITKRLTISWNYLQKCINMNLLYLGRVLASQVLPSSPCRCYFPSPAHENGQRNLSPYNLYLQTGNDGQSPQRIRGGLNAA